MAAGDVRCALGNHFIRGRGVTMTNPRHISFIKKVRPSYRSEQEMCPQCKVLIERIYRLKMERKRRRLLQSSLTVSSLSTSEDAPNNTDDDKPTTSKRAAARNTPSSTTTDDDEVPINVRRGIRLPHIQPAVKRRILVHTNPDVMNLYLQGLIGG